jgi:two-component system response regulator DevR
MNSKLSRIRVLVVDDSPLVREGIRAVLEGYGRAAGLEVAGEAASVAEAISHAAIDRPDVVLMDIRLPDGSGLEACRTICTTLPSVRILVLTSFVSDELVQEAVALGVAGYVTKEVAPQALVTAITDVFAGKSVLAPIVCNHVVRVVRARGMPTDSGALLNRLAPQERSVVALVAEGLTNKEIAVRLRLSTNTVKNYLVSAFNKLGVKRRSEAAVFYSKGTNPSDRSN